MRFGQKSETRQLKEKHLRERDTAVRREAGKRVTEARAKRPGAVKESRGFCRNVKKARVEEAKRTAAAECLEHGLRSVGAIDREIDRAIAERDSLRAGHKATRERRKERKIRVSSAELRAEERQQAEADVRHHLGKEWAQVFATWKEPARKRGDTRTLYEVFAEYAHDTPEVLDVVRERQHATIRDVDLNCAQAAIAADRGDFEAEIWHGEHCNGERGKKASREKSSAASRTASLYASGERPTEGRPMLKTRRLKRGPAPVPGQSTFGIGKFSTALIDTGAGQLTLGG